MKITLMNYTGSSLFFGINHISDNKSMNKAICPQMDLKLSKVKFLYKHKHDIVDAFTSTHKYVIG